MEFCGSTEKLSEILFVRRYGESLFERGTRVGRRQVQCNLFSGMNLRGQVSDSKLSLCFEISGKPAENKRIRHSSRLDLPRRKCELPDEIE